MTARGGPLAGVRVVDAGGIGPGPFASMVLADLGADVIRVDRPRSGPADVDERADVVNRGKRSVVFDVKTAAGHDAILALIDTADVLIEGFRPGTMERLELGPEPCLDRNPRLVYGRMTGWGQHGPLAQRAGHDLDYVALTGALWAIGDADRPPPVPLNLIGDYGGGSMFLLVGVLAALFERGVSGRGQVIDAAMVDGTAVLTTLFTALRATGQWGDTRAANRIDGAAPYYTVYECADGGYLAVGALEAEFYVELVQRTGFHPDDPDRMQQPAPAEWSAHRADWAALFRTQTRAHWAALLADTDACAQPVLDWLEATKHPHLVARGTFIERGGITQPAPAPRFSRTPGQVATAPPRLGEHTGEVLSELGRAASSAAVIANG